MAQNCDSNRSQIPDHSTQVPDSHKAFPEHLLRPAAVQSSKSSPNISEGVCFSKPEDGASMFLHRLG
jgi:hypothetical protein